MASPSGVEQSLAAVVGVVAWRKAATSLALAVL